MVNSGGTPRPAPVHTVEILRSHCGYYHSLLYMLPTMHVSRLLYQVPTIASALKFDLVCFLHDVCSSLVDQTTPFPSTGCIASPARGREGLATLAWFAWPISECGDDQ